MEKNPRYDETFGENIEDSTVETDGGKLTDKNQDSRDVLSQPTQPYGSPSNYEYKSTPHFSKNGKVEPQEQETANVFGKEHSKHGSENAAFGKILCKIWSYAVISRNLEKFDPIRFEMGFLMDMMFQSSKRCTKLLEKVILEPN